MRRMYEFRCAKDHVTEKYIDEEIKSIECPHCGNEATRVISAPRIDLEGITGAFPDAYRAWERKRNDRIKWERKTGRSEEFSS